MNKNKNFRKSAIVIPALALMVLTAGASATGAVAWFTANRAATANASTFTAYDPNGALTITATPNSENGTSLATDSQVNIQAQTGSSSNSVKSVLRDASYDNVNQKLYRAVMNDDTSSNTTPTRYSVVNKYDTGNVVATTTGQATAGAKVFYALSWDYTFKYNSINTNGSALFFDLTSSFSDTGTSNTIAKGFRIAFHATEGNHYTATGGTGSSTASESTTKVDSASLSYFTWTNNTDKATDGSAVNPATPTTYKENQYVGGEDSSPSLQTYEANKLLSTDSSYTKIDDAAKKSTDLSNTAGWLGTFTSGESGVNQIKVHVVAWYEGTDDNVVDNNATSAESITATMKFYVRDLAAAV